MEKQRELLDGSCAPREGGSPQTGRVPVHWEAPSQAGGAEESQKTRQNRDLEGRKQR